MTVRKALLAVAFVLAFGLAFTTLIFSQAGNSGQVGTYQVAISYGAEDQFQYLYITVIDTRSGEIVRRERCSAIRYKLTF
jgi:hypothetical protein